MPTEDEPSGEGRRKHDNGPSFGAYVETRFKLMIEQMEAAQVAMDLRYQQRFDAQSAALSAAFLSQQTAMQTAFVVAEKAVQAALAAAERAVNKAEVEAIQRNTGMTEKIDGVAARIDTLASRFDTLAGQLTGGGSAGSERRAATASTVQIVGMVVGLIVLATLLWRAFSGN